MGVDWSRPDLSARFRTVLITHAALMMSVGAYALVAFVITSRPGFASERPPISTPVAGAIAMTGFLAAFMGAALPLQITKRLPDDAMAALAKWASAMLMRGVMFEVVGVCGLVIALLGGGMTWFAAMAGSSGLLLILSFPRRASFEERWSLRGRM